MSPTAAPLAAFSLLTAAVLWELGTYGGILNPATRLIGLITLALLVAGWVWLRRGGWMRTALDRVLPLWALAFGIAFVANLDAWRRMLTAFWYVGLYVGLWYLLHDLLASRRLRRETLADALLVGGGLVVLQGWLEALSWSGSSALPRPVSTLENANTLAAFLIVLIPFVLGRAMSIKTLPLRLGLLAYALAAVGLLALTFSRSAWLALGAALLVQAALAWEWRVIRARWGRGVLAAVAGAVALITGIGAALLIRSFSLGGRTLDLRTEIYAAALRLFAEKPLTGYGLFTFGRELPRYWSTPPLQVHSHAHDVPLQTAAELGIPGLIALAITVIVFLGAMRTHYRAADATARPLIASGIAASLAFGLHHLADVPAMNPAIALLGLVALIIALPPDPPARFPLRFDYGHFMPRSAMHGEREAGERFFTDESVRAAEGLNPRLKKASPLKGLRNQGPISSSRVGRLLQQVSQHEKPTPDRRGLGSAALLLLFLLLLITGLWDTLLYTRYNNILWTGMNGGDPHQTADQLQPIIAADPALAIYHQQQGFFYGLAAYAGDSESLLPAIAAYERFVQLEPNSAVGWANLAALRWQHGEQKAAIDLMRRTVRLAPRSWPLVFRLGVYAEEEGDVGLARDAYTLALGLRPDLPLYPGWTDSLLQHEMSEGRPPTEAGMILQALEEGETQGARVAWESSAFSQHNSTESNVVNALLHIAENQPDEAEAALQRARSAAVNAEDEAWLRVGEARLAHARGDGAAAEAALAAARDIVTPGLLERDYDTGANVAYVQFFRMAVPRQFLPQVGYESFTPTLLHLLASAFAL